MNAEFFIFFELTCALAFVLTTGKKQAKTGKNRQKKALQIARRRSEQGVAGLKFVLLRGR